MSQGQQPGEELLPEEPKASGKYGCRDVILIHLMTFWFIIAEPSVDEAAVEQLMAMGFPRNRCMRALINTGNNGAEVAMNWLFEHMEDPGMVSSAMICLRVHSRTSLLLRYRRSHRSFR